MSNRLQFKILAGLLLLALVGTTLGGAASVARAAAILAASVEEAVSTFAYTQNMHPMGFSERENTPLPAFTANSDIAFWDNLAYHGNYDGFRIVDISEPDNPVEILDYRDCAGNQGDVIVWDNILVRSWNSPAGSGATCDGEPVLPGVFGNWEGLHVFDVSDPTDPDLVASVETQCGSHTATGVPDLANDRLLIYNSPSSGACPGLDIIEVPLSDPASASYLRFEAAGRRCHDTGVILGDVNLAACAGGDGFSVWSMNASDGGSLEDPMQLYSRSITDVGIGHTAGFSWDGEVLIFGHEPGGGGQARCQATSSETDRSLFFFESRTGNLLGTIVNPRPQTNTENCSWHNLNVVPTDKRRVLVAGNYQSGISVVEFTDPANAHEVAFADPAPLSPDTLILGGDWSTYWYNGFIYESDITRGLIVWNLSDNVVAGAQRFGHLNPQTQETSLPFKGTAVGATKPAADQQGLVTFGESSPGEVSGGAGGEDFGGAGGD